MNESMENLGAFLRQQREEKRVPIEELAVRTRIAVRFIKAIEENQFDQLPNHVSAKGFLRSYARCLGLDELAVLKGFSEAVQPNEADPPPAEKQEEILSYIQVKRPDRLPFPLWAALAVVGVIVLLLVLTLFMPKREEAPPPAAEVTPPPSGEIVPSEPPPGLEAPLGGEEAFPQPSVSTPVPSPPPEPAVKPLVLLVEAIESSWIQVNIDGAETKEALLQPNQKVKWEAKQKFILTVGNAGGVRVNLDGRDLGPFGPSGKVVKKEISAATLPSVASVPPQ